MIYHTDMSDSHAWWAILQMYAKIGKDKPVGHACMASYFDFVSTQCMQNLNKNWVWIYSFSFDIFRWHEETTVLLFTKTTRAEEMIFLFEF